MEHLYNCELIQDLMPGYIDQILSETGTKTVQEHLEHCEKCKEVYREMKEGNESKSVSKEQMALNGFRKIRKQIRIKTIVGVLTGLFLAPVLYIFLVYFVIGIPVEPHAITISNVVYQEEDRSLTIEGELDYAGERVSRVVWEKSKGISGQLFITVYMAETLPIYQGRKDFSITIPEMEEYTVYLESPRAAQMEVYNWVEDHFIMLQSMEEKIYASVPELDEERDVLMFFGIMELDGKKGFSYSVHHLFGEDVWHQYFLNRLVMHGDVKGGDFLMWISLEEPHQIFVYDFPGGGYTQDTSVILKYKEDLEEKEFLP